jgi:subtilisin family serine protease
MVLSTMGANQPGQLIGTAPKASYWLLRSEDGASEYLIEEYNWVTAAEFADSVGADIINSSLGYTEFNDPLQNHTYADMNGDNTPITRGADFAASRGMLVVNSLGNEGGSAWYYLSAPSDGDSVMGIGAVDGNGIIAGFSAHGPSYDGRVKPNVVAMGSGVYVINAYTSNEFTFSGGTSFSSPILAGLAACLWQANPMMTNMQIRESIEKSASQYQTPDASMGHGIPDFVMANNILTVIDTPVSGSLATEIFPNPVSDRIHIRIHGTESGEGRVVLSDLSGRVVFSLDINVNAGELITIPTGNFMPKGIYLLRLSMNGQVSNHKLVIG